MRRLCIIGASGHGKVVADIARRNGYADIVFLDDDERLSECCGYPVIGRVAAHREVDADFFVAIGNAEIRRRMMDAVGRCVTLIHPSAVISDSVEIGEGVAIMAGAVVNAEARIGRGCIVNTCASVDHDCVVGDFVHIAVGAHVCGTCQIGSGAWIGAGATVINNVNLCSECVIGAGAVVVRDIKEKGTYTGMPAKMAMPNNTGGGQLDNPNEMYSIPNNDKQSISNMASLTEQICRQK